MLLGSPRFCFFEVLWDFLFPLSQRALAIPSRLPPAISVRINWLKLPGPSEVSATVMPSRYPCKLPFKGLLEKMGEKPPGK